MLNSVYTGQLDLSQLMKVQRSHSIRKGRADGRHTGAAWRHP